MHHSHQRDTSSMLMVVMVWTRVIVRGHHARYGRSAFHGLVGMEMSVIPMFRGWMEM
jgi:hypothetical protein